MNGVVLKKGDRVYWHDPDEEICSGFCTVAVVGVPDGDESVTMDKEDGGLVEAYAWECEKVNGNGKGRRNKAKH